MYKKCMFGHFFNIVYEKFGTWKIAPWKIDPRKIACYPNSNPGGEFVGGQSSRGQFSGHGNGR